MTSGVVRLFYISVLLILGSCANPTVAVQSDIEKFKIDYKDQILKFDGKNGALGYAWSGNPVKRPIIFVHGSPGSWEGWSHFLLDTELQKNFHLIAVDRPGYGQSRPGVAMTSLKDQAREIMEILKINHSQKKAILVGHSFGGPVIARSAMDFPDLVAGLLFVASSVDPDLEETKWFQYPATWWPIRVLIPTDLRVCNEEIFPLKSELKLMLPLWKNIKVPIALIHGKKDNLVPFGNQDFLIKQFEKQSYIKIISATDLDHFIPWKRPDLISEGLRAVNENLEIINQQ